MPPPAYTVSLGKGSASANAWTTAYTVPSGKRVVLLEVCLRGPGTGAGTGYVGPSGGPADHGVAIPATDIPVTTATHTVYEAGETIAIYAKTVALNYRLTGYLFSTT